MRFGPLALLVLAAGLAWRMATLAPPAPSDDDGPTEVEDLFVRLADARLIHPGPDARLDLPAPDQALAAAYRGEPLRDEAIGLVRDLYATAAGEVLRDQVALWNRSRRLVAVRDDGASLGVTHGGWRAHACGDGRLLGTDAPVPEAFGYIHQGRLKTGFGDWTAAAGEADCVELRGTFRAAAPLGLSVLFLGRPRDAGPGIETHRPPRGPGPAPCSPDETPLPDQAGAWQPPATLWKRAADGAWELDLTLRLAPAVSPDLAAQGVRAGIDDARCEPQWRRAPPGSGRPAAWTLASADGTPLLEPNGTPTAEAQALGLVPLVGFGPGDYRSLGGLLRRTPPGGDLRLTLDAGVQAAARDALAKALEGLPGKDPWAGERRAALVVLDRHGAILAAAGHPGPPPLERVTPWDLAAFSRVYPLDDPLQVRAWEGVDRHQAAGSTFKPVTALAALGAAADDPSVKGMLDGLDRAAFKRLTGLGLDATRIDPYRDVPDGHPSKPRSPPTIANFRADSGRLETLGDLLEKPLSAGCPGQEANPGSLGLPSAVQHSLNVWFSALALAMDGAAADAYQNDPRPLGQRPVPPLHLIGTLRDLGFGQSQGLLAATPSGLGRDPPALDADQVDILGPKPTPLRWVLAQAAIGQGTLVTPLRMASLAASLAEGTQVAPFLDKKWGDDEVRPPRGEPLGVDLKGLRQGMMAVIQNGTAKKAFAGLPEAIRCHAWGKTGTAQIGALDGKGKEKFNTAWLIGWHEPPGAPERRLSFACMVTHVHGRDSDTGGKVCGPAVAGLLKTLSGP